MIENNKFPRPSGMVSTKTYETRNDAIPDMLEAIQHGTDTLTIKSGVYQGSLLPSANEGARIVTAQALADSTIKLVINASVNPDNEEVVQALYDREEGAKAADTKKTPEEFLTQLIAKQGLAVELVRAALEIRAETNSGIDLVLEQINLDELPPTGIVQVDEMARFESQYTSGNGTEAQTTLVNPDKTVVGVDDRGTYGTNAATTRYEKVA